MAAHSPSRRPDLRALTPSARALAPSSKAIESSGSTAGPSSTRRSKKRKSDERESLIRDISKTTKPFANHKSNKIVSPSGVVATSVESDDSLVIVGERTLDLDKALPRRRSWTPLADDRLGGRDESNCTVSPDCPTRNASTIFRSLSHIYGFSASETSSHATTNPFAPRQEVTRRRKVELSNDHVPTNTRVERPSRRKPRKVPLTITGKATELYRRQSGLDDLAEPAESPVKPGRKTAGRTRKVAKNAKAQPPRILTHEETHHAIESQDVIFGTSSQLVRDESPTTVRDTQRAIALSLADIPESSIVATDPDTSKSSLSLARSSRGLWAEASRDHTGSTVTPEIIDLTDPPYGMARLNLRNSPSLQKQSSGDSFAVTSGHNAYETSGVAGAADAGSSRRPGQSATPFSEVGDGVYDVERVHQKTATENMQPLPPPQIPDYDEWTVEELQLAIAGYGFKKMRNRKNMITRLRACWSSLNPNAIVTEERAKGTAAKSSRKKSVPPAATEHATISTPADVDPTNGTTVVDQDRLFAKIHEAIVTAEAPADRAELTWHAKILLYDPIVIEDLTVWLNAGHLTRVGVDEEIAPRDVRDWCESRSVCCLWRLNLRGGVRIRF